MKRVVITGVGAVSPYGLGVRTLVDAIWRNESGVRYMPEWKDIKGLYSHIAAPVPEIDVRPLLPRGLRRTMGDMAIYATLAAREAVEDAGLARDILASGRAGVAIGSTTGSPSVYETFYEEFLRERSMEGVRSGVFFKIMGHTCAANVCLALGIQGEQWAPVSACTSAIQAMGLGCMLIQAGRQDVMLCGGAEEVHHTVTMVFDVVKAASRMNEFPASTPRPFDARRDGVVCGGGGGILVLESLESARRRCARIYAEILGFGHTNDSKHIANPHEESMAAAMMQALQDADVNAAEVDYVNAHATGTAVGDVTEARAIESVVGRDVPVSSLKGHLGHTLGAAAALETIVLLEMFRRQEVLPTLNLEEPDPECERISLLLQREERTLNTILKNNFALGGVNASLLLRRWTE